MPYRTIGILSGLAGLALILFLLLLRRDLERHAISGPRWKRRLVTAGLVVLAALGFKPSAQAGPARHMHKATTRRLATSADWMWLTTLYRRTESTINGSQGAYPFTRKGKTKLLADLQRGHKILTGLVQRRLMTKAEAALVGRELDQMTKKVSRMRPTGMMHATCYKPAIIRHQVSPQQIKKLTRMLERVERQHHVSDEVIQLVRNRLRNEVDRLTQTRPIAPSQNAQPRRTPGLRRLWNKLLRRMRRRHRP